MTFRMGGTRRSDRIGEAPDGQRAAARPARTVRTAGAFVVALGSAAVAAAYVVRSLPGAPHHAIADAFHDPVATAEKWEPMGAAGIVPEPRNGVLDLWIAPGASEFHFVGLRGRRQHDFRNGAWMVEVDLAEFDGRRSEAKFRLTLDHDGNYMAFEAAAPPSGADSALPAAAASADGHGLRLHLTRKFAAERNNVSVPYDPVAHRWWKFRHDAATGDVHWEAGPDGRNWTSLRRETCEFPLHRVFPEIYAGRYAPRETPGRVRFLGFGATAP